MLLMSSSIIQSSQVNIQSLSFTVGSAVQIISLLFLLYLVLTGVLSQLIFIVPYTSRFNRSACMYFLSIVTIFVCLSTYKVLVMFLVPLAERSVLNFVHLRRVISSSFATSQGSLVSLVCQEAICFTSSLSVFLRCHPRSQDEILL